MNVNWKNLFLIPLTVASMGATPKLTLNSVVQSAMTRRVTVEYSLTEPAIVTLDVLTNGVSIGAANVTHTYGDVNRLVGGGAHRLHWQADKSWPGFVFSDDTVSIEVTAWATNSPPDYMVVDLSTGEIRYEGLLYSQTLSAARYNTSTYKNQKMDEQAYYREIEELDKMILQYPEYDTDEEEMQSEDAEL